MPITPLQIAGVAIVTVAAVVVAVELGQGRRRERSSYGHYSKNAQNYFYSNSDEKKDVKEDRREEEEEAFFSNLELCRPEEENRTESSSRDLSTNRMVKSEENIMKFVEMGFSRIQVISVLSAIGQADAENIDIEPVLDRLIQMNQETSKSLPETVVQNVSRPQETQKTNAQNISRRQETDQAFVISERKRIQRRLLLLEEYERFNLILQNASDLDPDYAQEVDRMRNSIRIDLDQNEDTILSEELESLSLLNPPQVAENSLLDSSSYSSIPPLIGDSSIKEELPKESIDYTAEQHDISSSLQQDLPNSNVVSMDQNNHNIQMVSIQDIAALSVSVKQENQEEDDGESVAEMQEIHLEDSLSGTVSVSCPSGKIYIF